MRKIYVLIIFAFVTAFSQGQVVLYTDSFNTGSSGWQLDQGFNFDTWIVNNAYNCSEATPDQGGGNYMHIYDDLGGEVCAIGAFYGSGSGGLVYATMTTGINTVGQTSVTIKFDWLCKGQTGSVLPSYGSIDYSGNGGSTWTNITQPVSKYSGQATWTTRTITSTQVPALLNKADLRLRFGFTNSGYGLNPAFAVDNIVVTGSIPTALSHVLYEGESELIIYPNPVKESLDVVTSELTEKGIINVYSMLGEKLITSLYRFEENRAAISINVNQLKAGMYFLELQSENGNRIAKFIKE